MVEQSLQAIASRLELQQVQCQTILTLDWMACLKPGDIFPLYDASPNYVSGHFLLKAPCEPVAKGDDTYRPTITVVAGHVDEFNERTHMEKIPLFYIAAVPDPLNGGSPRVTDIDLINLSGKKISFSPGDIVDINIQRVLGSIASDPYEDGPVVILDDENGKYNPVFDLNDDDHDGIGHTG